MSVLATFSKQPEDVQDYDIDYNEWLTDLEDTASNCSVVADTGIEVRAYTLNAGIVKVWLAGGTSGVKYKVTATVTTVGGRIKQAEVAVKVKEV